MPIFKGRTTRGQAYCSHRHPREGMLFCSKPSIHSIKNTYFNKTQHLSPAPEFPFRKVFQNNFQDSRTETEKDQQPNLGDFQRMLETDSTDGITALPLHWTCPPWIHIYIHRRLESKPLHFLGMKDSHVQHPVPNQAKQNKAGESLLKTAHQWI